MPMSTTNAAVRADVKRPATSAGTTKFRVPSLRSELAFGRTGRCRAIARSVRLRELLPLRGFAAGNVRVAEREHVGGDRLDARSSELGTPCGHSLHRDAVLHRL